MQYITRDTAIREIFNILALVEVDRGTLGTSMTRQCGEAVFVPTKKFENLFKIGQNGNVHLAKEMPNRQRVKRKIEQLVEEYNLKVKAGEPQINGFKVYKPKTEKFEHSDEVIRVGALHPA